jgi:hypothetical protein
MVTGSTLGHFQVETFAHMLSLDLSQGKYLTNHVIQLYDFLPLVGIALVFGQFFINCYSDFLSFLRSNKFYTLLD